MPANAILLTVRRALSAREPVRADLSAAGRMGGTLRSGVERGMAGTLSVVALLLVLLTLPNFFGDHRNDSLVLPALSLILSVVMVVTLPLALTFSRGSSASRWAWGPVGAYVGLLVIEPFILRDPLPAGSTPWLLALSLVAFGCVTIAETSPFRAGVICAGIDVALACVYAGDIARVNTLVNVIGLGLLALVLIAGVRALRARADNADTSKREAELLFEKQQSQLAVESERVRTDALLHDNVLAALLAAAGNQAPDRAVDMAETALSIVSSTTEHPPGHPVAMLLDRVWVGSDPVAMLLDRVWVGSDPELAPFRDTVEFDLAALSEVRLPPEVTDALISATVQALTNSVRHAGADATRRVTASRLTDSGLRIVISDDGVGFDPAAIPEGRLGVRTSILKRVDLVGGLARVESAPGCGTTVTLEWSRSETETEPPRGAAEMLFTVLPRRTLYRVTGGLIIGAGVIASANALFVTHAYTSVVASLLGLGILPSLMKGARRGIMSHRAAWGTTAVGVVICALATIGLDPATSDAASIARFTCGVLAGAVMGWMGGRRLTPVITVTVLVTQVTLWAGPAGVIRLGLAAEIVIVIAGVLIHRSLHRVSAAADESVVEHRDLIIRQAELDAFSSERQRRLLHAGHAAAPMLHEIIDSRGHLDAAARAECRVLEQALRDEIRGRNLLNNAIRRVVAMHRRRGALVQILDDGGLETVAPAALEALLEEVAEQLQVVRSSRIVVRTGRPDSDVALTVVASTPDETAAALGLDADDQVDLWVIVPRPDAVALAA